MAPSHDASSTSMAPEYNGDSSDCNMPKAGDSQPIPQPLEKAPMFA